VTVLAKRHASIHGVGAAGVEAMNLQGFAITFKVLAVFHTAFPATVAIEVSHDGLDLLIA
jgi:hypothetical protein